VNRIPVLRQEAEGTRYVVKAAREGARGTSPALTGGEAASFPVHHTRRAGGALRGVRAQAEAAALPIQVARADEKVKLSVDHPVRRVSICEWPKPAGRPPPPPPARGPAAVTSPGLTRRWAMREMGAVSMRLRPTGVSSGSPKMVLKDSTCRRDEQVRCSWW
jgi:hypothetical protein